MNPKLIGLNGKARSGKDTTADFIQNWCELYNLTTGREAFARRLKESAAHALGVFDNEVEFCNKLKGDYERAYISVRMATKADGPNVEMVKISGREFLQYYGTEAHRNVFDQNFWVNAVLPVTEGALGNIFKEEETSNGVTGASVTPIPDWWESFLLTDESDLFMNEVPELVADYCLITDCRFENEAQRIRDLGGQVWKIERDGAGAGNHASEQELPGELIDLVIDNNGTFDDLKDAVTIAMEDISGITAAEEAVAAQFDEDPING